MTDAPTKFQDALERILADQEVFRVTLQWYLVNMFLSRGNEAPLLLTEVERQVLARLAAFQPRGGDPEADERLKQLLLERAKTLFQEVALVVQGALTPASPDKN